MIEPKEQKCGGPLTYKNAPIALAHQEEDGRHKNGRDGSPIPDVSRDLVCDAEVSFLCTLDARSG